jgi:cytochrome c2
MNNPSINNPSSSQKQSQAGSKAKGGPSGSAGDRYGTDPYGKAADWGHAAAGQAKQAASTAASKVGSQVRGVMDRQVEAGAGIAQDVVHSIRCAAEDLDKNAPQLAGVVRAVADTAGSYADGLKGRSAQDLWREAQSFTRKQPALVFGFAAFAGFLAYRMVQSGITVQAPPTQPGQPHQANPFAQWGGSSNFKS